MQSSEIKLDGDVWNVLSRGRRARWQDFRVAVIVLRQLHPV